MINVVVTEEDIHAVEKLRAQGEFPMALAITQDLLRRSHDDDTRIRLLFNEICCSTRLSLDDVTNAAIVALDKLPNPEMSRLFVNMIRAISFMELYKPQAALDLIEVSLQSELMLLGEFQINKYQLLAYKGSSLVSLGRLEEALVVLDQAHNMYPDGEREPAILIDQANCLMAFKRYEDSYNAASYVLSRGDKERGTLAMQYMAESRMWQGRVQESLVIYSDLVKRLPCKLIDEERIQTGIKCGMDYLERHNSKNKPS